jgi:hypothetical protein
MFTPLLLEQVAEPGTEEVVVVDEEYAEPLLVGFLVRTRFRSPLPPRVAERSLMSQRRSQRMVMVTVRRPHCAACAGRCEPEVDHVSVDCAAVSAATASP